MPPPGEGGSAFGPAAIGSVKPVEAAFPVAPRGVESEQVIVWAFAAKPHASRAHVDISASLKIGSTPVLYISVALFARFETATNGTNSTNGRDK